MATEVIPQDFRKFLKLLEDEEVAYLLIGGYAVGYYGYPIHPRDKPAGVSAIPDSSRGGIASCIPLSLCGRTCVPSRLRVFAVNPSLLGLKAATSTRMINHKRKTGRAQVGNGDAPGYLSLVLSPAVA